MNDIIGGTLAMIGILLAITDGPAFPWLNFGGAFLLFLAAIIANRTEGV